MKSKEFDKRLGEVMDELDVLVKESNPAQTKKISRLGQELTKVTMLRQAQQIKEAGLKRFGK